MLTGKSVKAIKGVVFISLASGLAFAIPELLVAKYLGAELPALIGSLVCIIVTVAIAKIFYKKTAAKDKVDISVKQALLAWVPFILILAFILITSTLVPAINKPLSAIKTSIQIYTGPHAKISNFVWIANPGTLIILATFIGGLIQGAKVQEICKSIYGYL